jgi:superfamily II DNA or RNA helicase
MTTFAAGAIVHTRGREWVVQPGSIHPVYDLLPLGGTNDELTQVHVALESLASATFPPPDPQSRGDANSCRLLRDAARLATRHAAGPYRSFARLAFEPRPYQLVPLIMALRLDPVRLLIADDVGIGKTIEALLIARELFDRREITGFSVLCPPHLAEQWQKEMREKFHIEAELVLASTTQQLERRLGPTETIFQRFPFTVVSLDYVKSERRRREFLQTCPKLVIVDEAHTCTAAGGSGRAQRQMRYELLKGLAAKEGQYMLLTTATPHSGNAEAYEGLLGLLDARFSPGGELAKDAATEKVRDKELGKRFVQRRRPDIKEFLGDTKFPERIESDQEYMLGTELRSLVEDVAAFARRYQTAKASVQVQRSRGWAILTLFQAIASSPAAAAATLAVRSSPGAGKGGEDELTERGLFAAAENFERQLIDDASEESDVGDSTPSVGAFEREVAAEEGDGPMNREARDFFARLQKRAAAISADNDTKLLELEKFLRKHIAAEPESGIVVFCRFIATAEYLARELSKVFSKKAIVDCVVGSLPDAERKERIARLGDDSSKAKVAGILVCTDCLSEGINLQEDFDTVIHYDLSWNPNRHVQREGRVDRFGQPRERVNVCFFHSDQTVFDPVVMNVLNRKRREIAAELGYLVAVPVSRDALLGLILDRAQGLERVDRTGLLFSEAELERCRGQVAEFDGACERLVKEERALRLRFRQHQITPEEVAHELEKVRNAIGSSSIERFTVDSLGRAGCTVEPKPGSSFGLMNHPDTTPAVHELVDTALSPNREPPSEYRVRFDGTFVKRQQTLTRAHPLVESLASYVLQSALDPVLVQGTSRVAIAARTGLMRTKAVTERTTIVLLRNRFQIEVASMTGAHADPLLAEDVFALAIEGDFTVVAPKRLSAELAAELINAQPSANVESVRAERLLGLAVDALCTLSPLFNAIAVERANTLAVAHDATRSGKKNSTPTKAAPTGAPDILGLFILMPDAPNGGVE